MNFYENTITGDEIKNKVLHLNLDNAQNLDTQTSFSVDLQEQLNITNDCDMYIDSITSHNTKTNYHQDENSCILMSIDNLNIKTYSNDSIINGKILIPHTNSVLTEDDNTVTSLDANQVYKVITKHDGDRAGIVDTTNDFSAVGQVVNDAYFVTDLMSSSVTYSGNTTTFKKIVTNQVIHKGNKINFVCTILPMKLNKISGKLMFLDGNPVFNSTSHRFHIEFLIKPQKEDQRVFYDTKPVPSKSKYPELSSHYSQLEAKFGDKQSNLPFMDSLYENINYLSYGLDKKILVLKLTN